MRDDASEILDSCAWCDDPRTSRLRAQIDRDLETMLDLEDSGEAYAEGGCVWCWSTGEHNPSKSYPVEHIAGCPIKVAIDRLVAAGAKDSLYASRRKDV